MPIETTCPHCGSGFRDVPDDVVGTEVRCRGCQEVFTVEVSEPEPTPQSPPEIPGELVEIEEPAALPEHEAPRITFADLEPAEVFTATDTPPDPPLSFDQDAVESSSLEPHGGAAAASPAEATVGSRERTEEDARPTRAPLLEPEQERAPEDDHTQTSGDPAAATTDEGTGAEVGEPKPGQGMSVRESLPILTRLEGIVRKCHTLSQRHADIGELAPILEAAIDSLRSGHGPRGEDLDFREVAATLLAMPRLFAKRGFATLAKEIEFVEKALVDLQAQQEGPSPAGEPGHTAHEPEGQDQAPRISSAAVRPEREDLDERSQWPRRALLIAAFAGALLAVTVAALLIRGKAPVVDQQAAEVTPAATASPPPSPTPAATPEPRPTDSDGHSLPDLVSKARRAHQSGDLDRAIVHLSILAMLDRDNSQVLETVRQVIETLMQRAKAYGDDPDGLDQARAELDRARDLARRFELPMSEFNRLERRLIAMERIHRCSPRDSDQLQAQIGRQVEVILTTGDTVRGSLLEVSSETLTMETRKKVGGGGYVTYTTPIPVSGIEEVVYTKEP